VAIYEKAGGYQAVAVGVALVCLVVALSIPLLHRDDCAAAPGSKTTGNPLPFRGPCPGCKFLANSYSDQIPCDAMPVLTQSRISSQLNRHSLVVITSPCEGSILLRGPPVTSLS